MDEQSHAALLAAVADALKQPEPELVEAMLDALDSASEVYRRVSECAEKDDAALLLEDYGLVHSPFGSAPATEVLEGVYRLLGLEDSSSA